MNKVAFVIPIYPKDYTYLSFLCNLSTEKEFDIILVLSYHVDKELLYSGNFEQSKSNNKKNKYTINELPSPSNITKIYVLEDFFPTSFIDKMINKKMYPTFKTYFALEQLVKEKSEYEYIACTDCEITFKNTTGVYDKFSNFFKQKKILGASVSNQFDQYNASYRIVSESAAFFTEEEQVILREKTNNYSFYSWFSDIPLFDMKDVDAFLRVIKFYNHEEWLENNTWFVFTVIPYYHYLVLNKGFELIDTKNYDIPREWSMETATLRTYIRVIERCPYTPMWVVDEIYSSDPIFSNIVMTNHTDRAAYSFND